MSEVYELNDIGKKDGNGFFMTLRKQKKLKEFLNASNKEKHSQNCQITVTKDWVNVAFKQRTSFLCVKRFTCP